MTEMNNGGEHREASENPLVRAAQAVGSFLGISDEATTGITPDGSSALNHKPEVPIPKPYSSPEFRRQHPYSEAPENAAEIQAAARANGHEVYF